MADIYCKIPPFLVYKGLNSTNFVRIGFRQMVAVLILFYSNFIFGFLCLTKPDSDRITTFGHFISPKMGCCCFFLAFTAIC